MVAANGIPIMAHPPANTSDLTLQKFLDTVRNTTSSKKGVKLDFKSTAAFNLSIPLLEKFKDVSISPVSKYMRYFTKDRK